MLGKMYHNGCVHHIVDGDDLEWFPRTHNPGSLRQLLYRCTCCTCCTGTAGTAGTPAVQQTRVGQQLLYAVPAVPLYLLYRGTAGTADRRGSVPTPSRAGGPVEEKISLGVTADFLCHPVEKTAIFPFR